MQASFKCRHAETQPSEPRNSWILSGLVQCLTLGVVCLGMGSKILAQASANSQKISIGMIGLDTSHAPAFTKLFNAEPADGPLANMRVVAAFPGGSEDIASSRDRVEGFTEQMREMDVEIVDSIEKLLPKVDVVVLASVDGRKHLSQVAPVFAAGKRVFIDKPLAASLPDAIAIDLLAKEHQAEWFSGSSLRFSPDFYKYRTAPEWQNAVRGASAWSPCSLEPTHSDLFWYGVHGVETLYTAMGPGCKTVTRVKTDGQDLVVGQWPEGRIGTFRGIREGKTGYGIAVYGDKAIEVDGSYAGYQPLVEEIAKFFRGGPNPVAPAETIEMFTFMAAAQASSDNGGIPVELKTVHDAALQDAHELVQGMRSR